MWEVKFEELAEFNACKDKGRYNASYLKKMADLQTEYNYKQIAWAKSQGYVILA